MAVPAPTHELVTKPRQALVIGAGLAGAALCAALTRRGWRVTLLDAESGPARRASALPVGMLSPHVTRSPTPMSQLSALGVADMRAELERLLPQGQGWMACEVDNLGHDPGRWPAAMVRPGALVLAWLAEAAATGRLDCLWGAAVRQLQPDPDRRGGWQALGAGGQCLAQAPTVLLACAWGAAGLLAASHPGLDGQALPLRPVKGQMSLGALEGEPLAARPLRDNGVFVPSYTDTGLSPDWPNPLWAMGSTYERGQDDRRVTADAHERNAQSLERHSPAAAAWLRLEQAQGRLLGWADVRCASLDRVPLLGAVPDMGALQQQMDAAGHRRGRLPMAETPRLPGLYLFAALGSRGLSLSHWGAQDLARQLDQEPDPLEPGLRRALDPARFAWRLARRQPVPA